MLKPSRLPIVACEFLFSGEPVIDILTIAPPTRLVQVVLWPDLPRDPSTSVIELWLPARVRSPHATARVPTVLCSP